MTENGENPSVEARVQQLQKQVGELQKQVAALTKMVERIVRPANKFVNAISSDISAVKEHHKGSENPVVGQFEFFSSGQFKAPTL